MDSITTIKDHRIRVKASKKLLDLLMNHSKHLKEIPENIRKLLQTQSIEVPVNVETINDNIIYHNSNINIRLLKELTNGVYADTSVEKSNKKSSMKSENISGVDMYLHLSDLRWLSNFLSELRKDHIVNIYLNEVLEGCHLELPKNEVIKRNPELEARCQKLREEQQNLEYRKMTKNVDAVLKHYPEDTVAYQIKAINSQIIAVLQFIFSVAAGFAFGFLGINLIIGNMEFGLRLLLGIMCALIIALAEIYFLAKKLNEYDNTVDTVNKALKQTVPSAKKVHAD